VHLQKTGAARSMFYTSDQWANSTRLCIPALLRMCFALCQEVLRQQWLVPGAARQDLFETRKKSAKKINGRNLK